MHDYNNLIIIGYKGGYGGDLISTMIDKNFNRARDYSTPFKPELNRYNHTQDGLSSFKNLTDVLKYFNLCYYYSTNKANNDMSYMCDMFGLEKIYNFCCEALPEQAIQNLITYFRYKYEMSKPRVINTHYVERPPELFSTFRADWVFPSSTKIRLICEPRYADFFNALCFFKLDQVVVKSGEQLNRSTVTIEDLSGADRHEYLKSSFEDFVDVDVGRMFFEGDEWVDKTQDQLSDILKTKIALDKNFICNEYKPKNSDILKHMLGTKYLDNSVDTNLEKFLNYAKSKQL